MYDGVLCVSTDRCSDSFTVFQYRDMLLMYWYTIVLKSWKLFGRKEVKESLNSPLESFAKDMVVS